MEKEVIAVIVMLAFIFLLSSQRMTGNYQAFERQVPRQIGYVTDEFANIGHISPDTSRSSPAPVILPRETGQICYRFNYETQKWEEGTWVPFAGSKMACIFEQ